MKSKNELKTYYPAILVLIAVLSFSLFSFYQLRKSAKARRVKLFELYTNQATERLEKRIIDYAQILRGCQSLFHSSTSITAKEWKLYTDNLKLADNYPGIQGVGFAKYISSSQKQKLEQEIRKDYPDFKIKSLSNSAYLTPIIYIEPKDQRNLRALGFDMFSESNRRQAMIRSMVTGQATITKKVILMQETNVGVQPGFLIYLPVYRNSGSLTQSHKAAEIEGFVYMPFRAYDLMNAVFKGFSNIDIKVYDQNKTDEKNILYRSSSLNKSLRDTSSYNIEFRTNKLINIAGSKWTIHFEANNQFGSQVERAQPQLVLIFGVAISILLYLLTLNYIHKRQTVLEELNLSKEIERKKDEFIGIASHELKTPLTSIKAYLQMLGRSELGEREKSFVNKANAQTNKLNSLIADLLDVSKIQAGSIKLNTAPFELKDLINESIESVLHMYQSHNIVKPSDIPDITLNGDKLRLEQALINLLVNAIKYSPGAGVVTLNLSLEEKKVILSVIDKGIGISKNHQSRVFEKFTVQKNFHLSFRDWGWVYL